MHKSHLGLAFFIFEGAASVTIAGFKLLAYPEISWWMVFIPFLIPLAVAAFAIGAIALMCAVFAACETRKNLPVQDVETYQLVDNTVVSKRWKTRSTME